MSKRTILSRPRTRVYDANYNIGESMYKPALAQLDRKYYGRSMSPPKRLTSIPSDILERHERAFLDDDLDNCRRRAEKHITGDSFYDSRGARLDARDLLDGFDEETVSRIKGIRASKKVSVIDDADMDGTVGNFNTRRLLDRSEKILDSLGLGSNSSNTNNVSEKTTLRNRAPALDEEVTVKRRSVRISQDEDAGLGSREVKKWSSAFKDEETERADAGASVRAKQTRVRLTDLEDEMEALNERAAEREKKAARLRALIAEVAEEADVPLPTTTSSSSSRRALRFKEQQEEEVAF